MFMFSNLDIQEIISNINYVKDCRVKTPDVNIIKVEVWINEPEYVASLLLGHKKIEEYLKNIIPVGTYLHIDIYND